LLAFADAEPPLVHQVFLVNDGPPSRNSLVAKRELTWHRRPDSSANTVTPHDGVGPQLIASFSPHRHRVADLSHAGACHAEPDRYIAHGIEEHSLQVRSMDNEPFTAKGPP
jgi:hypothetical protein